jgi:sugar lactone lactonase YvrE
MRRFLTLVCLLCLAIPAGISFSGCTRNPGANYCNGLGYGLKIGQVASIDLEPRTTGISLAFGQTQQVNAPTAKDCKGNTASASSYIYGTTNNQLVDISPSGNICAGTWNRNTGGGIANYTTCSKPNPLPSTGGLPYGTAYITATANSVSSNPVEVYVHAQVTSITLVTEPVSRTAQQCFSQGTLAQLDAQACYSTTVNGQPANALLCAPSSVTNYACPLPAGVTSVPNCTTAIGSLNFFVGIPAIATINNETNQITAAQPGTTNITASVAGSGSSAGYFSTCPPQSISVMLNGGTNETVTQGVQQNLVTTVTDVNGNVITGLSLDYQSTDPIDISATATGGISTNFSGEASVYAICQPPNCNPSPINVIGLYGTGLSISSNPVTITTPGTASDYLWFAAPGQSQYLVSAELLTGTISSTARLPYVPNSMVVDRLGSNLYFGSSHELMEVTAATNTIYKQDPSAPGVVLAVSPDSSTLLINDQVRQLFYIYSVSSGITSTYGGMGSAAAWTPDLRTLYITDSAALNNTPANVAAGITGHSDILYIYNQNTGWTTYSLPCSVYNATSCPSPSTGAQNLAITIPSVGAYFSGNPTVAHTWCPSGIVGNSASMSFYPQPPSDSVAAQTDVLAATTDGHHILGAAFTGSEVTLSDIGVTIPATVCPGVGVGAPLIGGRLSALSTDPWLNTTTPLTLDPTKVSATAVNQVVASPASNLAFITYNALASNTNAQLPYYVPNSSAISSSSSAAGTVGYVTLTGGSAISAPLAGAFSPDDKLFFVSTAGDNKIHYISVPTLTDTQQIAPNLPACTPGTDLGCTLTSPTTNPVPATVIAVKPRSTT